MREPINESTPPVALMSAKQVGELLGLSARKVYALAADGSLPAYRFGRAIRFDTTDVEAFKAASRVRPATAMRLTLPARRTAVSEHPKDSDLMALFRANGIRPRLGPRKA